MKNLHTPGPWTFELKEINDYGVTVYAIDQHEYAPTVENKSQEVNMAEVFGSESNACLIAAAPELLEAANEAYDAIMFLESKGVISKLKTGNRAILSMLGEAIRKAKGL